MRRRWVQSSNGSWTALFATSGHAIVMPEKKVFGGPGVFVPAGSNRVSKVRARIAAAFIPIARDWAVAQERKIHEQVLFRCVFFEAVESWL